MTDPNSAIAGGGWPDACEDLRANVVLDVSELGGRSSPEDEPDMMLVTVEELDGLLRVHLQTLTTQHTAAVEAARQAERATVEARVNALEKAGRAMLAHSCVADADPEDKDEADHAAERAMRGAIQPLNALATAGLLAGSGVTTAGKCGPDSECSDPGSSYCRCYRNAGHREADRILSQPAAAPAPVVTPEEWVLVPRVPAHSIVRAMAESTARDDEGKFEPLGDLIGFSGENKTHTVLRQAWADGLDAAPTPPRAGGTMEEEG